MKIKAIEKVPDVIFIEWCPSKLVWYDNPVTLIKQPQVYWVSAPFELMDLIGSNSFPMLLWKEDQIQKDYASLSLGDFAKTCKLQILGMLKMRRKSVIIFSTPEIIKTILPTLENDLPRQLSYHTYRFFCPEESKYYIYFDHTRTPEKGVIPFMYQRMY